MGNRTSSEGLGQSLLNPKEKTDWEIGGGEGDLGEFKNQNGDLIGYRSWIPINKPRALVFLVHGLHEHGGRYSGFSHVLTAQGFAVFAHDHISHGRSRMIQDSMGLIPSMDEVIDDAVQFWKSIAQQYADLPVLVMGHSMGSIIAGNAMVALKDADADVAARVKGAVISGASIKNGVNAASPLGLKWLYCLNSCGPMMRCLTSGFAAADPTGPGAPLFDDFLSHDIEYVAARRRDELVYHGWTRNKTAAEIYKGINSLHSNFTRFDYPVYIVHGGEDSICLPVSAQTWFERVASEQKEIKIYEGLYHEIINEVEPQRTQVITDIVAYFVGLLK